jgi:RNA-binding protein Nova
VRLPESPELRPLCSNPWLTGARACVPQLSQNGETFPGSEYRVVLITHAEMQPVLTAVSLLLQKVAEEDPTSTTIDGRFTVPDGGAADAIHGESGEMLQNIMQQTATQMALAQNPFKEGACERDPFERVLTISGSLEAIIGAVASVLTEMQKVPAQGQDGRMFKNMSTNYGSGVKGGAMRGGMMGGGMMGGGMGMGMRGGFGMGGGMGMGGGGGGKTAQILQVPDQMIGAIVGRAGQTINEIMSTTQTRVQISQKGEYIPGTRNRQVTVSGPPEAIQYATSIITQKLQEEAGRTGQVLNDLITGMPPDSGGGMMGGGYGAAAAAAMGGMQTGYGQAAGYGQQQGGYGHGGYGQQMGGAQQQAAAAGYYGQQGQQGGAAMQMQQTWQQAGGQQQQQANWAQQGGQQAQGYGVQHQAAQGGQQAQPAQPGQPAQQQWPQAGGQQHAQGMQHGYGQQQPQPQQPQQAPQQAGYPQQQMQAGQQPQQQHWPQPAPGAMQPGMQQPQPQQMGAGYQAGTYH